MIDFKIANVLLESTEQFYSAPLLYCRAAGTVMPGEDGAWKLMGPGTFDFTTFFNGLSVMKWKRYTVAESFSLHLEVRGAAATLRRTHLDGHDINVRMVEGSEFEFAASDEWQSVTIDIPVEETDVVCAFALECAGEVEIRNGYYAARVQDDAVRDVELALCTTTFRKEDYIRHNVALVRDRILNSDEAAAKHFRMHVVDNGRTLEASEIECDGIELHPNPNYGGSAGFARGMIEAMEQDTRATHVLLLDDDVTLSPESLLRTFNLLSLVNDEYATAFVSGAMMCREDPDILWEDTGFLSYEGNPTPVKYPRSMGPVRHVALNELTHAFPDFRGDMQQEYAGWWYCVIPMSTVDEHGLPIPVFVRYDDTEYALRVRPKFMTMNGICVWHDHFNLRYSAAVERYQVSRNSHIMQMASGVSMMSDFLKQLETNVVKDLRKFNYTDVELALEGFEDFLSGPDKLLEPGYVESRYMDALKNREKLKPFEEVRESILEETGVDVAKYNVSRLEIDTARSIKDRALDHFSVGGQLHDFGYVQKGKVAVVSSNGWELVAGRRRRADTVVVIDPHARLAGIRHLDRARFKELWSRYRSDLATYKRDYEKLRKAYADSFPMVVSVDFWKKYLALEG